MSAHHRDMKTQGIVPDSAADVPGTVFVSRADDIDHGQGAAAHGVDVIHIGQYCAASG